MTVALVDCNGFYAACEKVFRPDLEHRPVVVLSNNDGCIVAMSREARNLGIPRGIPLFKARNLLDRENVAVFSSNYALYADLSRRVMDLLRSRIPLAEVYSIDEAFLQLDHLPEAPLPLCRRLRSDIRRGIGLPTSIGVAPTKVLAKIAAGRAKRLPGGLFALGEPAAGAESGLGEADVAAVLAETPVTGVWGIASGLAGRLKEKGIGSALELRDADDAWVKRHLTLTGLRIVWELRGIPSIALDDAPPAKKGIMSSRSFGRPVAELNELLEAVGDYTARAAAKLRAQGSLCRHIDIWLTTDRFRPGEPRYSGGTAVSLDDASDYLPDLVAAARRGLRSVFREGYRYKKVAVFLSGIEPRSGRQTGLFDDSDPRKDALSRVAASLRERFGPEALGCVPRRPGSDWDMRRECLSPRYTTSWTDLATARIG